MPGRTTGPPFVNPNSLRVKGGRRPGLAAVRRSKKLRASSSALRRNSKTAPCTFSVPDLVATLVKPAAPWPIEAGHAAGLGLKFLDAAPVKVGKLGPPQFPAA